MLGSLAAQILTSKAAKAAKVPRGRCVAMLAALAVLVRWMTRCEATCRGCARERSHRTADILPDGTDLRPGTKCRKSAF